MFYVYIHIRLDTGEIFYVGKGQKKRIRSTKHRNLHWRRIVEKHGRSTYIHSSWENESDAFAEEVRLIAEFRKSGVKLVNLTEGGEGSSGMAPFLGKTHSAETRAKISAANKGNPGCPGYTHSAEARAKISAAMKGNTHNLGHFPSAETRAKISLAKMGHAVSVETREKLSAINKGYIHSQEARTKMSLSRKGHVVSAETRAKISAANKGRAAAQIKPLDNYELQTIY